jgi:4-amino-4-deoxy-L-arabinose transferase-like glycosyltransferase
MATAPAPAPIRPLFFAAAAAGVALWLALLFLGGNHLESPLGVGGDAGYYVLLASNLAAGRGFSFAGVPSAFHPPLYPLFLAAMMRVAGRHAFAASRMVQVALGIFALLLLARLATRLLGESAGCASLILGLFLPAIFLLPTALIPETFGLFLTTLFLTLLLAPALALDARRAAWVGFVVGVAALVRFNLGLLGIVAAWTVVRDLGWKRALRPLASMAAVFAAVMAPWLVRNYLVFGRPLLSTEAGVTALDGIVSPLARALPGENERIHAVGGWTTEELETNNPRRVALGPEPELDHRAWRLAWREWRAAGWGLIAVELDKLAYFWLTTDQLHWGPSLPFRLRALHVAGVVIDWFALALALLGWRLLARRHRRAARLLVFYAVVVTVAHLPFVMASRYRFVFIEPVLVLLGGAAVVDLGRRLGSRWLAQSA